jgi:hypothetical protein
MFRPIRVTLQTRFGVPHKTPVKAGAVRELPWGRKGDGVVNPEMVVNRRIREFWRGYLGCKVNLDRYLRAADDGLWNVELVLCHSHAANPLSFLTEKASVPKLDIKLSATGCFCQWFFPRVVQIIRSSTMISIPSPLQSGLLTGKVGAG